MHIARFYIGPFMPDVAMKQQTNLSNNMYNIPINH